MLVHLGNGLYSVTVDAQVVGKALQVYGANVSSGHRIGLDPEFLQVTVISVFNIV